MDNAQILMNQILQNALNITNKFIDKINNLFDKYKGGGPGGTSSGGGNGGTNTSTGDSTQAKPIIPIMPDVPVMTDITIIS